MWKKQLSIIAISIMIFGVVSLITSFILNFSTGKEISKKLLPEGGIVGPVSVKKNNSVYKIWIRQSIRNNKDWSFLTCEVLDQNKKYLFSFGKELWKESGYDSDGSWSESVTESSMKINLEKGTYYLKISSDKAPRVQNSIYVSVKRKIGSALGFLIIGILAIIFGAILNEILNQTITGKLESLETK